MDALSAHFRAGHQDGAASAGSCSRQITRRPSARAWRTGRTDSPCRDPKKRAGICTIELKRNHAPTAPLSGPNADHGTRVWSAHQPGNAPRTACTSDA